MKQSNDQQLNIESQPSAEDKTVPVEEVDNQPADIARDEWQTDCENQPVAETEQVETSCTDEGEMFATDTDAKDSSDLPTTSQQSAKSKLNKFWDITLWVLIVVLAVAVVLRLFVFANITIDGVSMTAAFYAEENSETYNPDLTYHDGQVVRVLKLAKPARGDVVVFYEHAVDNKLKAIFTNSSSTNQYKKLIKRVVALAGDKIWIEQVPETDDVYRLVVETAGGQILHEDYYTKNGQLLDERAFYIVPNISGSFGLLDNCTADSPFVVSDGYFFVMGDNRPESKDSRILGEIPLDQLFGVVRNK